VLRALGWRFEGRVPDVGRCVAIVAPHTSNWDFVVGLAGLFALGLDVRWLGKHTIFKRPFRRLLRWTGGIPVDRAAAGGVVATAARLLTHERMFLAIAPEGTRRRVDRWKTGFYRIAESAGVPIVPIVFDWSVRTVRFAGLFHPTGDLEADLAVLHTHYSSEMACKPENY
jgi:1-acyl-sn-glycerol-3-phosphate acyltransferase